MSDFEFEISDEDDTWSQGDGPSSRQELIEQAETVLSAVEGTMYYPVAHGEAERLKLMIEETVEEAD